jgi:hypothetical protein
MQRWVIWRKWLAIGGKEESITDNCQLKTIFKKKEQAGKPRLLC